MIKNKKGVEKSIFYLFLILFFGWIITEFILINQNYLTIKNNEITGLAFQVDPIKSLWDFFGNPISISGGNVPTWLFVIVFGIIIAIMYTATGALSFFEGEERRGARIVVSIGIALTSVLLTPVVYWIALLSAYVGSLGAVFILILIAFVIYIYTHRTISQRFTELTQSAEERQNARNALITARNQQPPQQRPGFFRRVFGGATQQQQGQQPQARQQRRQAQRQAQQNLRQQQQIRQRWLLFLQQAQQNLNLLTNQLNNQRNWNTVLGQLARVSQIRNDLPRVRTGNIGALIRSGQNHMQRVMANPNDARIIALATQFLNNIQITYNLIMNQL